MVEQIQGVLIGPWDARLAACPFAPERRRQQLDTISIDCALLRSVEIGVFVVVHEGRNISNGGGELREH
jgi:hypothetical protein